MVNIKQETIRGAKWGILQRLTLQPLTLIYGMVLARLITPAEMGIVGLTAIFFAVATQLSNAGFGTALVRKLDRTEEDCSTMFWFNVGMSFLVSLTLFLLAPWFTRFYNQPELLWLTRASAINMFLSSTASVHWTLYQCRRDFKTPAIVQSITAIAGMPVCLTLAWMGWGVWALMWQGIFTTILSLAIIWIISPWKPRFIFSKASFLELFGFGSKLAISGSLNTLYMEARTFIVGKFYSPADLGLYSKGRHLANMVPDTIMGILGGVIYPVLATVKDDDTRLAHAYRMYIKASTLIIAWCSIILIALANPLVELLYGKAWLECVPFLQITSLACTLNHLNTINLNIMIVKGRSDIFLHLEIVKKTVSIIMLLYAATISVMAICWASAIYSLMVIMLNAHFSSKLLGITWKIQMTDCFPYLVLAALSCVPGHLCTYTTLPPFIQLIIGGTSSVLLYFGTLHLIKESTYAELYNTIKNKILPFKSI